MKKKFSKIFGVGLTIALVASLLVIAAPVSAQPTLVKVITDDEGVVGPSNPMSGDMVKFVFTYTGAPGANQPMALNLLVTGPEPYATFPFNMLFFFPSWEPASEKAMMEMGIVDRDGDGTIQDDVLLVQGGTLATGYTAELTFWLDTTKNWRRATDDLRAEDIAQFGVSRILDGWNRSAHTSVWSNSYPPNPYFITSTVFDSTGATLFGPYQQHEWLYNEPYLAPLLATDVKGAKQIFVIKYVGPDYLGEHDCLDYFDVDGSPVYDRRVTTWEVKPGVELSTVGYPGAVPAADVIIQRAGYYCNNDTVIVDLGVLAAVDFTLAQQLIAGGLVIPSRSVDPAGLRAALEALYPHLATCPDARISAEWGEFCSIKVGDAHFFAHDVKAYRDWGIIHGPLTQNQGVGDEGGYQLCIEIQAEKKWGWIQHTELDVDLDTPGIQTDHLVPVGDCQIIQDRVFADFLWGDFPPYPVQKAGGGGAIVHWWLFEDYVDPLTGEHVIEVFIDELMALLASYEGGVGCEPAWGLCGCGRFPPPFTTLPPPAGWPTYWTHPLDWITRIYNNDDPHTLAVDAIDPDGSVRANFTTFTDVLVGFLPWSWPFPPYLHPASPALGGTSLITVAEDSWWFELPGRAMVRVSNTAAEDVIIVTYVEYPVEYSGENPVCVEKARKTYKEVVPAQVKTPQVRWAGEKIVLEKDWNRFDKFSSTWGIENPDSFTVRWTTYVAVYSLEEGTIGDLEAIPVMMFLNVYRPDGTLVCTEELNLDEIAGLAGILPGGGAQRTTQPLFEGKSSTIHVTELQGQADINAACYLVTILAEGHVTGLGECVIDELEAVAASPVDNHGFLVYYLAFEDVVLAEGVPLDLVPQAGEQIDITPLAGLRGLNTVVDDADVAVQVRGWFTSPYLPGTTRPPRDIDGDGLYDLPAGRYVLPNDWPGLAGYDYDYRPNWDLMEQAHIDAVGEEIDSDFELGPYDGDVATTVPPAMAVWPSIGPFSTLQQWTQDDIWNAGAMVPCSDITVPSAVRNTVVPDGELNWFDCPMPQALVIFDIVAYDTLTEIPTLNLSNLLCCNYLGMDKGDLEVYGYIPDPDPTTFGTATAVGTTFTLQDTTQAWTVNALVGRTVCIERGLITYERVIAANTANTLSWLVGLPTPVQLGDAYFMKIFESPFYMVEVPSHWAIPAGYNWNSWIMWAPRFSPTYPQWVEWGPYDYWTDLFLDSIIANTTEPNQIDWEYASDVEVYCDNHGIAAVTIDALNQFGTVTLTATAEYPYAPKKGKYPACASGDIMVTWGPPDLNPHFLADKQQVELGEVVTFDNLTVGGTHPYVRAAWDFDADGVADTVIEGVEPATMADVAWAYDAPDLYSVILTMTDSAGITRWEERPNYILVGVPPGPGIPGDANGDGVVDALDITMVEMIIAGLAAETPGADANEDGVVDALDITMVEMIIAGLA